MSGLFDGNCFRVDRNETIEFNEAPLFDISRGLTWEVDIRSSIQRAITFVEWAASNKLLNQGLLVIGNGPVGMAASLAGTKLAPRVARVDLGKPFGRIFGSPRWIDPHLYFNWPKMQGRTSAVKDLGSEWFPQTTHPKLASVRNCLAWKHGAARDVVDLWSDKIDELDPDYSVIVGKAEIVTSHAPARPQTTSNQVLLTPSANGWDIVDSKGNKSRWGTILVCLGPGDEETTLKQACPHGSEKHFSFPYWATQDPLWATPPSLPDSGNIVVIGGADGGQQDLFRILTAEDPVEIAIGFTVDPKWKADFITITQAAAKYSLDSRDKWRPHLKKMLKDKQIKDTMSRLFSRFKDRTELFGPRTFMISRSAPDDVSAFALNHLFTIGLELISGQDTFYRQGEAIDDTQAPTPSHHSDMSCVGEPHTILYDGTPIQDVRRFLIRTGPKANYRFGSPRHVTRSR